MYRAFRANPKYLTSYHLHSLLILLAADAGLVLGRAPDLKILAFFAPVLIMMASTNFAVVLTAQVTGLVFAAVLLQVAPADLLMLPAAFAWSLFLTAILHNAAHDNLRPRFLRHAVGEFCGLAHLVGFRDWTVIHLLHHAHADDPKKDPHAPGDKPFWPFLMGMREGILRALLSEYFGRWGQTPASLAELKKMSRIAKVEQLAKIGFWYLLLGPQVFAWFFTTSIVFKMLHYAWFNHATHKKSGADAEIVNLDSPLYKAVNTLTFGLYFHKNHHENPRLFDPRTLSQKTENAERTAA